MTYDLEVVIRRVIHSSVYTDSVAPIFDKVFEKIKNNLYTYVRDNCKDWKEAVREIQPYSISTLKAMIEELKQNGKEYEDLISDVKWGDVKGATEFLEKAYNAMLVSTDAMIELLDDIV